MHKTLLLILSILLTSSISAQPYQSMFGNTSTAWIFTWSNLPGNTIDSAYVQKDTMVNGISYKKIMCKTTQYRGGLMREDTTVGRVWFRNVSGNSNPADTAERLLFDYGLNVGDTFVMDDVNFRQVDTVDSVTTVNGLRRISFRHRYMNNERNTFVEGVGGTNGVLAAQRTTLMQAQYLLCSYKDGVKTSYNNQRYSGDCQPQISGSVSKLAKDDVVTLYPNPVNDVLHIGNTSNYPIKHVQVTEPTGRILIDVKNADVTTVNISLLHTGMFFLRLFTSEVDMVVKPFIVQH